MTIDHSSEFDHNHEMTSGKKTPVIRLHRFTHRGQDQIGLDFTYNRLIKDHLQRFDQVRWTQTHQCLRAVMAQYLLTISNNKKTNLNIVDR